MPRGACETHRRGEEREDEDEREESSCDETGDVERVLGPREHLRARGDAHSRLHLHTGQSGVVRRLQDRADA